jgi:hypothetical protein
MKTKSIKLLVSVAITCLYAPVSSNAATIWNGPLVSESNVTEPDKITSLVWITRGASQGIYNAVTEQGFTHFLSPKDTEWADGTTTNYSSLSYTDWNTWAKNIHGGPPNTVGINAVVHLKTDDIYIDIMFTSWETGGAYSYMRSTPSAANLPPSVAITSPTNGATFTDPAIVPITATASDPDGSVTNVSIFDGSTSLGGTNAASYTVTANLAPGGHTLTAVANDNLGLSVTSAVVNVTIVASNVLVSLRLTVQRNGNQLDISWPVTTGHLETQSNSLTGMNWFTVPGSSATNHIIVPLDQSNGSVFYRLVQP